MTHPAIEHIDQVLPHIAGRTDFVHARRDGYSIVDYLYAEPDTFDDAIRRECRGLKFGPDGRILARPLHKFFNIDERPETQAGLIDLGAPHVVLEKLDGSMVHPAIVAGELVLMTRMGRSDVARKAERHLTAPLRDGLRRLLDGGKTPILEFTAPDNRIVIAYARSELHLLAVRETISGRYLPLGDHQAIAATLGVRAVATVAGDWHDTMGFLAFVRAIKGQEGFVLRFASGLWLKAKGEDYVLKHKSKEAITLEKNALALLLAGGIDDVMPLLAPDEQAALARYAAEVTAGIGATARRVAELVTGGAHLDQKAFAVEHLRDTPVMLRTLAFAVRGGQPAETAVRAYLAKQTGTQTKVDNVRALFAARFAPELARIEFDAG